VDTGQAADRRRHTAHVLLDDGSDAAVAPAVTLVNLLRTRALTLAQRRTVVIGVALQVAASHACREVVGPLHPGLVLVPPSGQPRLRTVEAPGGWSTQDDLVSIRRLARALTGDDVPGGSVRQILRQLGNGGEVAALPSLTPPAPCGRRRRWWGRAR
jgi:hypothetical protein